MPGGQQLQAWSDIENTKMAFESVVLIVDAQSFENQAVGYFLWLLEIPDMPLC